jgi:hypothetical protein
MGSYSGFPEALAMFQKSQDAQVDAKSTYLI